MSSLPDDIARCHDITCEVRSYCQRFVQRNRGGPRVVHAATLRPAWQTRDELCDHAITLEELSEEVMGD
jgi:hypothetical protein